MNKFRDLLYDKNDIFIAIIIMLIAVFIIVWRIDSIMAYPQTIALAAAENNAGDEQTQYSGTKGSDTDGDVRTPGSAQGDDNANAKTGTDTKASGAFSVYINYGDSVGTIADYLVTLGFFKTNQEALAAIEKAGAAQKLQAGTHTIPRTATPEEAIAALCTPGA